VKDQRFAPEVVNNQTGSDHIGGGAAIGSNDKTAEVSPMSFAERTFVGSCAIRIPVPAGVEASNPDAVSIDSRFAAAVTVKVEAVFTAGEAFEIRADHQTLIRVGSRDRAD